MTVETDERNARLVLNRLSSIVSGNQLHQRVNEAQHLADRLVSSPPKHFGDGLLYDLHALRDGLEQANTRNYGFSRLTTSQITRNVGTFLQSVEMQNQEMFAANTDSLSELESILSSHKRHSKRISLSRDFLLDLCDRYNSLPYQGVNDLSLKLNNVVDSYISSRTFKPESKEDVLKFQNLVENQICYFEDYIQIKRILNGEEERVYSKRVDLALDSVSNLSSRIKGLRAEGETRFANKLATDLLETIYEFSGKNTYLQRKMKEDSLLRERIEAIERVAADTVDLSDYASIIDNIKSGKYDQKGRMTKRAKAAIYDRLTRFSSTFTPLFSQLQQAPAAALPAPKIPFTREDLTNLQAGLSFQYDSHSDTSKPSETGQPTILPFPYVIVREAAAFTDWLDIPEQERRAAYNDYQFKNEPYRLLFICTENHERSAAAEKIAEVIAARFGILTSSKARELQVTIRSKASRSKIEYLTEDLLPDSVSLQKAYDMGLYIGQRIRDISIIPELEIHSAGFQSTESKEDNGSMAAWMISALNESGYPYRAHFFTKLTPELLSAQNRVLGMNQYHAEMAKDMVVGSDIAGRIISLPEYAGSPDEDIMAPSNAFGKLLPWDLDRHTPLWILRGLSPLYGKISVYDNEKTKAHAATTVRQIENLVTAAMPMVIQDMRDNGYLDNNPAAYNAMKKAS